MSALKQHIIDLIRQEGPISVARYMELALTHPRFGYYMTRDPLGRAGDFITAPEISQMFGELIGLWLAQAWIDLGQPERVVLAEAGPGRGTLMADALRAARVVPGFRAACELHLVEMSPSLRAVQATTLRDAAPRWHERLSTLPEDAPLLLVANEFLDALPIRQFERRSGRWHERLVGEMDGTLAFGLAPMPEPDLHMAAPEGAIREVSPAGLSAVAEIAGRIVRQGGAALIIDYGHDGGFGDTLQAMRAHAFADPLDAPGSADLTAHVDFAAVAAAARQAGARVEGPVAQGPFLLALGLSARADRLMAASPGRALEIAAQRDRLTEMTPTGMGQLFKVLALRAGSGSEPSPLK
jgi:NADH dehydrogenase [ubiquinone] 1 alpha subcomplex assembly factor 7